MSDASSARQRDMLSPAHSRPSQRAGPDAVSIAFAALLIVGVIALGLAGWLLVTLPGREPASGERPVNSMTWRALQAEQTRDAQQAEIVHLYGELDRTRQQLATAVAEQAALAERGGNRGASTVLDKPPLALVLDAPVYRQGRSLSCESSAAAMAAHFFGIDVGEEAILAALPRHDNPHKGFRGNVDGLYGGIDDYGVYAEPVRQVLVGLGLQAEHLVGGTAEIRAHIRQGKPVIAWVTYDLQFESPTQVTTSDGEIVVLVPYEHAVLVTGYNRDGLWVNDPYSGIQTFYLESEFSRAFSYLGNMGLVVGPPLRQ